MARRRVQTARPTNWKRWGFWIVVLGSIGAYLDADAHGVSTSHVVWFGAIAAYVGYRLYRKFYRPKRRKKFERLLFVDCETNGLPKNRDSSFREVNQWPRVVSISWNLSEATGEELSAKSYLVQPEGWKIPKAAEQIHGISTAYATANGVPVRNVLKEFLRDATAKPLPVLICHNVEFDWNTIRSELVRAGFPIPKLDTFCTMERTTEFCDLPGGKWPRLGELHYTLFNCGFDGAHSADADVAALKKCFFELHKRGALAA